MKAINSLSQILPVVLFSAILFGATNTSAQNHWKKDKRDRNEYRERDYNRNNDREYSYRNDNRHNDESAYRSVYYNRSRHDSRYFEHPRYGRVYERFDYNPIVFHHSRDNYYYYGNQFYTYRRGVGYCIVEPPRNVYFRTLPAECERVYINGNVFFRHGDLFFQFSPRGYSIVTSPAQVRITARF